MVKVWVVWFDGLDDINESSNIGGVFSSDKNARDFIRIKLIGKNIRETQSAPIHCLTGNFWKLWSGVEIHLTERTIDEVF